MQGGAAVETYHNGHAGALNDSTEHEHANSNLPAGDSALHSACNDNDKGYKCAQLNDYAKRDEKADCAPHVAERRVLAAVATAREGNAGTRDG